MNSHWQLPPAGALHSGSWPGSHAGRFELAFLRHGQRTAIGRQYVSYPYHLTRPFALDPAIPSLLTVYQQSSSGGLYRGERLACRYDLGEATAAHMNTQAATVVHDCHGQPARQDVEIVLGEGAFFAFTPDPLVLFPGAAGDNRLEARLAPGAVLLLADAFAMHDPQGAARPFDRLVSNTVIRDAGGRLLVRDAFDLQGYDLAGPASPLGKWRVVSSFMLAGDRSRLPAGEALAALSAEGAKVVVGVTTLANEAGWGVRCLAGDAVSARRIGQQLFSLVVEAAFGHVPVPRRK